MTAVRQVSHSQMATIIISTIYIYVNFCVLNNKH